jgi:ssDNA-binding Zn-finger/Zn-ribbon topoisomerase 1
MAQDRPRASIIAATVVLWIAIISIVARISSSIFAVSFWRSELTLLGLFGIVNVGAEVIHQIRLRKRCAHGVRSGNQGGCTSCALDEIHREAEYRAEQAFQKWQADVERLTRALFASEFTFLCKAWLSRSEGYLEMSPRTFEDAVAELFRELGYFVEQTPYTNDGGKDAVVWKDDKKYLVECKRYEEGGTIGRRELQIFVAAMKEENADGGFYVNTGRFANTAYEYAVRNQIRLYDRKRLPELINSAYPLRKDIAFAAVMCRVCGIVQQLPVAEESTIGTCVNGHVITNRITKGLIRRGSVLPDSVCHWCGAEMRLRRGSHGKFWGCSQFPQCKFTRSFRKSS